MSISNSLKNRLTELNSLANVEKKMIVNGIDKKLEQLNFQQKIGEMYKPITDQLKLQNESIQKLIATKKDKK